MFLLVTLRVVAPVQQPEVQVRRRVRLRQQMRMQQISEEGAHMRVFPSTLELKRAQEDVTT